MSLFVCFRPLTTYPLSPVPGVNFHCEVLFPGWRKILCWTDCSSGAAFNKQESPAGEVSPFLMKYFFLLEKKVLSLTSSKTQKGFSSAHRSSFFFVCFSCCCFSPIFFLLIINRTKPSPFSLSISALICTERHGWQVTVFIKRNRRMGAAAGKYLKVHYCVPWMPK